MNRLDVVRRKRATSLRIFQRVANQYDRFKGVLSCGLEVGWKKAAFATLIPIAPCERHLDLATGTGDLLDMPTGASLAIGVDLNETMLRKNRHRLRAMPVHLVRADLNEPPFSASEFDLITIGYGLRYAADPVDLLRTCRRMLRPGGRLFVFDVARPSSDLLWYLYLGYLWSVGTVLGLALHLRPGTYWHLPQSLVQFVAYGPVPIQLANAGFRSIRSLEVAGGLLAAHVAAGHDCDETD